MSQTDSLKNLVREAGYLRDHLLRVEGQDSIALGVALQPFERVEDISQATDEQIRALSAEFQTANDRALASVDGYTLNEVLKGRSPYSYRASIPGSFSLTVLGVLLVATAFYFSNWASRATFAISEAESFVEFDHFNSLMKLIELEAYFEQVNSDPLTSNIEPQLVYLEGLSDLKAHYYEESTLPTKMTTLIDEVNPVRRKLTRMRSDYCRAKEKSGLPFMMRAVGWTYGCKTSIASNERRAPRNEKNEPNTSIFWAKIGKIDQLQKNTMSIAGRVPRNEYVSSIYRVEFMMQTLTEWLNVVYLWALPIIYGALGSIVYCMWRVLNPNLAALGALYTIMRTSFAGLAALTLSMLLVPSNILTIGVELNRPMIYLLSFVFGYSIEAFVSTLNILNTYLTTNLTPKPRRP